MNFNDQQLAYINAPVDGPKRVLAGPGSGKTTISVHRIRHLIEDEGVSPDRITAVTFSKAGADALQEKAVAVCSEVNISRICTIHALSYRALNHYGKGREPAVGKKGFLVKKHAKTALDYVGTPEVGWKALMAYIGHAKNCAARSNVLEAFYQKTLEKNGWSFINVPGIPWATIAHEKLAVAHRHFDMLMRQDGVMMFHDMLCEFEWLLQDDEQVLAEQRGVTDILTIDEAQDTNPQAMRILTNAQYGISGGTPEDRVTLIGDTDQSIYGFIGAQPEVNMWTGFEERFPGGETYMLETNYRSVQSVVTFTNTAIKKNYTEDTEKYRKNLIPRPDAPEGDKVTYDMHETVWEEAEAVSEDIHDLLFEQDREPGDIYVLARTRAQLPYILMGLFRKKIPAATKSGFSFWDLSHIQDLVAYLRLSVDLTDSDAFCRVYNKASNEMKQPFDKIDKTTGRMIIARGATINHRWLGQKFLDACGAKYTGMHGVDRFNWREGKRDLEQFMRKVMAIELPGERAEYVVRNCLAPWWAYDEGVASDDEGNARVEDMMTVVEIASQTVDGESVFPTTEAFLAHIDELIEKTRKAAHGDASEVVLLSTIHGVKGEERPVVYVIGVCDGLLPHWTALSGMVGNMDGSILPLGGKNDIEDERRLFFVAVSRAKELVRLSGIWNYRNKALSKSRFAYETGLAEVESLIDAEVEKTLEGLDDGKAE